ncbi:MAG: GreA/GreB family elongation factor [Bdellovibrionales bacterium]|nr:GreA/GreB family elongation factor [Bdellovibrionales bacterium]
MEKRALIQIITKHLQEELLELRQKHAADALPSSEIQSMERALLMYRFLPIRPHEEGDAVAPASLVLVELSGRQLWIFLVPQNGGLITHYEGQPVQVLTPQSPLGEAILGKRTGDQFSIPTASGTRDYRILQIL